MTMLANPERLALEAIAQALSSSAEHDGDEPGDSRLDRQRHEAIAEVLSLPKHTEEDPQ